MRTLYLDALCTLAADWWCRPEDILQFLDAALPGAKCALRLAASLPIALLRQAAAAGLVQMSKQPGQGGWRLRLADPTPPALPEERLQQIAEYVRSAAALQKKKSGKGVKQKAGEEEAAEAGGAVEAAEPAAEQEQGDGGEGKADEAGLEAMRLDVLAYAIAQLQVWLWLSAFLFSVIC